jgi:hypothetical protein
MTALRAERARRMGFPPGLLSLVLAAALVLVVAAACSSPAPTATVAPSSPSAAAPASSGPVAPSDTSAPSDSGGPVVPDSPVAGVVVTVSPSSGTPTSFTLKTNDGVTIDFMLGPLENAADFAPTDLQDRQSTSAPILVFFKPDTAGKLVVYRIEDAG